MILLARIIRDVRAAIHGEPECIESTPNATAGASAARTASTAGSGGPSPTTSDLLAALPPGPYELVWPDAQGGLFKVMGRQGTPPDFLDGWAIPLVAIGASGPMTALADFLNATATPAEEGREDG